MISRVTPIAVKGRRSIVTSPKHASSLMISSKVAFTPRKSPMTHRKGHTNLIIPTPTLPCIHVRTCCLEWLTYLAGSMPGVRMPGWLIAWLDLPNWMAGCLASMVGCLAGWQPCPRMPKVSNRTELTNKMPGLIKRVAEMRVHRIAQNGPQNGQRLRLARMVQNGTEHPRMIQKTFEKV